MTDNGSDWTAGMSQWARDISQTLGRMDGKLDSLHENFMRHVEEDEAVEKRVSVVERHQASQRAANRVWAMVAAASGTILGALGSYFERHHG